MSYDYDTNTAIPRVWSLFIGETAGADNQWVGINEMGIYRIAGPGWGNTTWYRSQQQCVMNGAWESDTFAYTCAEFLIRRFSPNRDDKTRLRSYAYIGSDVTTVTIPATVASLGRFVFLGATNLQTIIISGTTPPVLHANTFTGINRGNIELIIPLGTVQAYIEAGWVGFRLEQGFFPFTDVYVRHWHAKVWRTASIMGLCAVRLQPLSLQPLT